MINYRKADCNDLEKLLGLIEEGFSVQNNSVDRKEGWEHRVLFSYLFDIVPENLERVYLAEEGGFLAAAVGLIPQQLFLEGLKLPVWAISPVVTHPKYRSKGIAGNCIRRALEDLSEQGIYAVFLWGLPTYYPRLGFVPILPRFKTKLTLSQIREQESIAVGNLRIFENGDLESISLLYNQGNNRYWLQPERSFSWWCHRVTEMNIELGIIREVPFPKKENFMVWENHITEVLGYLYFQINPEQKKVIITEGTARDSETALAMVQTFAKRYLKSNWLLYVRGTPEHLLNTAAYRLGGTHFNPSPLAGMIKIIDWSRFLDSIRPLFKERYNSIQKGELDFLINKEILRLGWDPDRGLEFKFQKSGSKNLKIHNEVDLTRLILGFYNEVDFDNEDCSGYKTIFPVKNPFIWDANYLY